MQYKAVNRSSQYLVHFNKNHDPKSGRFTFAKIGDVVKGVATDVGRGFKGGAKVVVKGVSDSGVGDKLKKVGGGLKSVGSEVGRGFKNATNTVKKELNDPSSADFNGDKVAFPNSVITKSSNPDDYRSPDLDKDYSELEKSGVFNVGKLKNLHTSDDANQVWGKDMVNAMDIGIKALGKTGYATGDSDIEEFISGSADEPHKNALRSWFVFEDQTYGYPEAAYLVNAGWSKDKIFNSFKSAYEQESKNNEFSEAYLASKKAESLSKPDLFIKIEETRNLEPYKNVWPLSEGYINGKARLSEYIDACTDVMNESKAQHSIIVDCGDYLAHFNKNHSKANGQFTSGDGDSDGITDDHHNYKKNKIVSRYSGENARKNLIKDGTYKVHKNLNKITTKPGKHEAEEAQRYSKILEVSRKEAMKRFERERKTDKTLDEFDLEDFIEEEVNKRYSPKDRTLAVLLDAGFEEEGAKLVADYLSNPFIK